METTIVDIIFVLVSLDLETLNSQGQYNLVMAMLYQKESGKFFPK